MKIEVKKAKMSEEVIKKIINIDKTFYKDFDYSNESWYFERYSEKNDIFLLFVDEKIVGYFLFYSVSESLFFDLANLKYKGDYDFPIDEINVKSNYFYMPSLLVLKNYRKYSILLIFKLKEELENKQNVIVIAQSIEGKVLSKIVLKKVGNVENVEIYSKQTI